MKETLKVFAILITFVTTALGRTTRMSTPTVFEPAALFLRSCNAHAQFPIPKVVSVEHLDGFLCLRLITHLHKSKALGSTAITVLDQSHRRNGPCLKEQASQVIFRGGIRQIPN